MAATLNSEDIALILAAVEGSTVLAKTTDLAALALEASLAPLALNSTVAKEASLAPLALEASLAPLALEASLAPLALETSIATLPTAVENGAAVWEELAADHVTALTTGYKLGVAASSNPSAAAIADAVWDEPTVGHTTVGSTGEAILATITALYPSAVSIASALWAKIITGAVSAETALAALYNGWTADVGAGSGAGAIVTTITITAGGSPVDGAEVWVTLASDDSVVIAGTLVTDVNGEVVFMLDAATYHLWRQKAGVNFTNPETIVVTA